MTGPNEATVAVQASGVNLSVTAVPEDNGNVNCQVTCNGQNIGLVFTSTDIFVDLHENASPQ